MNTEVDPVHIGQEDDIDVGSVENFEHEEIDYAIFRLESGFFALQGHCHCEDQTFISESSVEGEEYLRICREISSLESRLVSLHCGINCPNDERGGITEHNGDSGGRHDMLTHALTSVDFKVRNDIVAILRAFPWL